MGSGSYPQDRYLIPTEDNPIPQHTYPLDYNRAHSGFLVADCRFTQNDGPEIFGSQIFSNMGLNLLFSFTSGVHFTSIDQKRNVLEPINSSITPWSFQLDARLDKSFFIGSLNFNIYLWITNLLNTKNVVGVYNTSGDPYDDGYLNHEEGQKIADEYRINHGPEFEQLYRQVYKAINYNENHFGIPRQIRLGLRINY
jgi:hypothetical protein